jgi:hypothetical protein
VADALEDAGVDLDGVSEAECAALMTCFASEAEHVSEADAARCAVEAFTEGDLDI